MRTGGDAAVVVKRAVGAAIPRLRQEAERLRAAAHPGVVAIVRSEGDDEGWELHLAHGGRPVSALPAPSPEQVAGIVAAAASTVADLHVAGIVHGHLSADHVLLGGEGRVRLCGLGPDAAGASAADDVAALGGVLARLLGDREEMEPVPERRWRRAGAWSGWTRRSLLTIADQAMADPPSRRPSARRLASAITAAVPAARVPEPLPAGVAPGSHRVLAEGGDGPPDDLTADRRRGRLPALVGAVACVVVLGVGAIDAAAPGRGDPAGAPAVPEASSVAPSCSGEGGSVDGCAGDIEVDGRIVTWDGRRFVVGEEGDQVVVGDWSCTGRPTAAVLRPATGEVFVFERWADERAVHTTATTVVDGGRELIVDSQPAAGCGRLMVLGGDGSSVAIELRRGS